METLTWQTILIWSAILTVAFLLLSSIWKMFKKFLKIWVVILLVMVVVKFAYDNGII